MRLYKKLENLEESSPTNNQSAKSYLIRKVVYDHLHECPFYFNSTLNGALNGSRTVEEG